MKEHVNDEAYTSMKGKMDKVCTPYALIKENGFFLKGEKKTKPKMIDSALKQDEK